MRGLISRAAVVAGMDGAVRRVATIVAGLVLACSALSAYASAAAATTGDAGASVVVPTGQFPADVANVQAAVDKGGIVVLGATNAAGQPTAFNFGPAVSGGSGVNIRTDVSVTGEHTGTAVATIDGGDIPFLSFPGVNVTISGITFESPFYIAVAAVDPSTAAIRDNHIEHVAGLFTGPGVGVASAISVFGGNVAITGNVIDDVNAPFAEGISQGDATGSTLIAGNRVSNVNEIAIESGPGNVGKTQIVGNTLAPGPQRYPRGAAGTAIETNGTGTYEIKDNNASCVNPNAICLFSFGQANFFNFGAMVAPMIADNQVTEGADGVWGIGLVGQVSQARVTDNEITGIGQVAFALASFGFPGDDLFGNAFLDNKLVSLTSTLADVFFDTPTHGNVYSGQCRTALDLGTANQITCTGNVGQRNAASIARKLTVMAPDGPPPVLAQPSRP